MLVPSPSLGWPKGRKFDWTTTEGINKLRDLVRPTLSFEPAPFQLTCSAHILNGTDVFCVAATGEGKSALIYIPILAQKDSITLVIQPTNFLEIDMCASLQALGINGLVINADTLATAARTDRNLWKEATSGAFQAIMLSPEALDTTEFNTWSLDPLVRDRWATNVVDEAHLADEWGIGFRAPYRAIWTLKARAPDHTATVAISGSVEGGRQTESIISAIGFRPGAYHFEKRDCERRNIALIFRDIQYSYSGHQFRDLDWLIPSDMAAASDIPKRLLFSETIEMGHRITLYLRQLLPPNLQKSRHILIRHMHSLNCEDCKAEGIAELYKVGNERACAIFVATAVLEVGLNIPDLEAVVIYPGARSSSSVIQCSGRPARLAGTKGEAYVYVKKVRLTEALKYVEANPNDPRLLKDKKSVGIALTSVAALGKTREVEELGRNVDDGPGFGESVRDPSEMNDGPKSTTTQTPIKTTKRTKRGKRKPKMGTGPGKIPDSALLLQHAAHARQLCVQRQINMVYDNPNKTVDCGRCSSCAPRPIPEPRPLPSDEMSADNIATPVTDATPTHLKLMVKDVEQVAKALEEAAYSIRRMNKHPDSILLSTRCFLTPGTIKSITRDFHLVTSKAVLKERMTDWRYWEESGEALWEVVDRLGKEMRVQLEDRHQETLAKRRAAAQEKREEGRKVKTVLANAGLSQVKRVTLKVVAAPVASTSARSSATTSSAIVAHTNGPYSPCPIPPNQFYAAPPIAKRPAPNLFSTSATKTARMKLNQTAPTNTRRQAVQADKENGPVSGLGPRRSSRK